MNDYQSDRFILYTIFLPLTDNNGNPIEPALLDKVQDEIVTAIGGLTRYAPGVGVWRNPMGHVYRDLVLPIQILVPDDAEMQSWIVQQIAKMAALLEQEQIFVFAQVVWLLKAEPLLNVNQVTEAIERIQV